MGDKNTYSLTGAQMNRETITLPISCTDEECGMVSAFRFWRDGSFKLVMKACGHTKTLPNRAKVLQEFDKLTDAENTKGNTPT